MNRKHVGFVGEARGVGVRLAAPVVLGVAASVASLDWVALGVGEWLGVALREGLAVTERLVPMVLFAARPVDVAPGDEIGITLADEALAGVPPPPLKVMNPSAPTATAAAVALPTTSVRFLRRAAPLARD